MPAAGKTALAIHAAHRLSDHFPDGQLFCGLGGGAESPASPADVLARLLKAAGFAGKPGSGRRLGDDPIEGDR